MTLLASIRAAFFHALADHASSTGAVCRARAEVARQMGHSLSCELWTAAAGAAFDVVLSLQAAACEELGERVRPPTLDRRVAYGAFGVPADDELDDWLGDDE